ncbi:hypothetical protein KKC83_04770 [Patescibacteria group bacterium]|nr:hypothetical protein [Patescibacteria group bacterium]MCG2697660.1 hypothetical protein [Candidatus Parcubacteria bacterium]MBU4015045.1 hypothetical protein [Patescibacteria group bacterium]MBU4026830.1 hypothetical protein [Patescibacteria group bacterium]MBU4073359.1 hypothetical protein [Patescibacteria group bacterium]
MKRPIFVPMKLRQTCVGMIHKFVPPKEVIMRGKEFQKKKRQEVEKESKEE